MRTEDWLFYLVLHPLIVYTNVLKFVSLAPCMGLERFNDTTSYFRTMIPLVRLANRCAPVEHRTKPATTRPKTTFADLSWTVLRSVLLHDLGRSAILHLILVLKHATSLPATTTRSCQRSSALTFCIHCATSRVKPSANPSPSPLG